MAVLGRRVDVETALIELDGAPIGVRPDLVHYLLNKPAGVVTTADDPEGRPTVVGLVPTEPRVFPVGRLDFGTEGLLLLTNDGELAQRILHPRYKLPKVYEALVEGRVHPKTLKEMKKGTQLEDGFAKPDRVRIIRYEGDDTRLEIVFHEGRKHIVKRFLAKFGHRVKQLHRTQIGPIKLGKLPPGKMREMTTAELNQLKHAAGLK